MRLQYRNRWPTNDEAISHRGLWMVRRISLNGSFGPPAVKRISVFRGDMSVHAEGRYLKDIPDDRSVKTAPLSFEGDAVEWPDVSHG